jgi:2,5-diamino-6-(ribosylamino)-4(3H)-pyrimidinone 5'-phosphate reductase
VSGGRSARPRVIANCAISADGRLAYAGGRRARLYGPEDLERVHRLRAASGAIVVGLRTVERDDPSLRVKWELLGEPARAPPWRVVLDSKGRTPPEARVLDGSQPTIIATAEGCRRKFPPGIVQLPLGRERVDLGKLLAALAGRGVRQVMVEGGAEVLSSFLRAGLVDELTVYVAPVLIGGRTAPAMMAGPESAGEEDTVRLSRVGAEALGEGTLLTYRPGETLKAGLPRRAGEEPR